MKRAITVFIRRLLCQHQFKLVWIEWDGTSVVTCRKCGKQKSVPL